jgi:hypothetical protein
MVTVTLVPAAVPVQGLDEPEHAGVTTGVGIWDEVMPMVLALVFASALMASQSRPSTTA